MIELRARRNWSHLGAWFDGRRLMGWRDQGNRNQNGEKDWRSTPLRERYDWFSVGFFFAMLGGFIYALWSR